ncbi:MAG: filamentous hemagglutinin N-terminal domain-containing protein, partial [Chlorobiales bacterium]|nr:filamentous hemagglutinin N-terminal domain-containing protein [Chlorobiales bacterium]
MQTTDRAILNWQTFNIGAQAKVEFHQPDAHAAVLNRVLTSDPSGIYGALRSNGQVFLVNPSGIVFGKGASVNVGSLVASTMSIGDRDFLNGTYHFNRNGSIAGIVNHGNIVAADGGCVALFAPEVTSDGLISARLGSVMLASGEAITLGMGRDDLYSIAVDPSKVASAIENRGMIQADGGHVLMQASTAGELLGSVINNGGTVQARTAENRNGTIVLLGDMESGSVQVSGTLDASAPDGGDGGFIETSAAHVRIDDGTKVTTLATNGKAGTWLIDPHDFTIASDRTGSVTGGTPAGDISGTTLQNALAAGNVTILSSQGSTASGSGDINVNDNVTWWNNTLTLIAARNININAVLSVRDSNPGAAIDASDARIVMNTATANGSDTAVSGGTVLVGLTSSGFTGRVDFDRSGTAVLTINSAGYNIINSRSALQGMVSGNSNVRYVLGSNISADSFTPIGTNSTPFKGVLDGLGHTIDNLTVNTSTDNVGLFGVTNSASIRNIGITNVNLQGGNKVGAVVGYAQSTSILNSWSSGIIHLNYSYAGGLVGSATNTVIEKSYSTAAVSSSDPADLFTYYTGGLVGYMQANSSIRQSYSSGNTTGGISVGGIAGYMIDSTITSTYSNADEILGTKTTGGIVGNMQSSSISDSEFRGNKVTQRDTQYASDCGGLVGYAETSTISQSTSKGIVYGKGSSNGGL